MGREEWQVGRKEIVAFLRPYIKLNPDADKAWRTVRRWRIRYGLPIDTQPNGKPYIDPPRFTRWWNRYQIRVTRISQGPSE